MLGRPLLLLRPAVGAAGAPARRSREAARGAGEFGFLNDSGCNTDDDARRGKNGGVATALLLPLSSFSLLSEALESERYRWADADRPGDDKLDAHDDTEHGEDGKSTPAVDAAPSPPSAALLPPSLDVTGDRGGVTELWSPSVPSAATAPTAGRCFNGGRLRAGPDAAASVGDAAAAAAADHRARRGACPGGGVGVGVGVRAGDGTVDVNPDKHPRASLSVSSTAHWQPHPRNCNNMSSFWVSARGHDRSTLAAMCRATVRSH